MKHPVVCASPTRAISLTAEIVLVLTTMLLMCLAYLERFRKALWEVGGQNSWNYISRQQQQSESSLAISVLAASTCIARLVLAYFKPAAAHSCLFNTLNDIMLSGFWIYSIAAQCSRLATSHAQTIS
ncbi:hypothetical protein F4813DRAFT_181843 [Daldinia decipiens]|uniref:uncharacterized protein n=1 Tax=Daldinia decipiens TaxID=326647 RepID=UPI0020C2FD43|nr:uncharacterized protein F4813DRAFT_181843 [Daldinia decipiens]KAI1655143.1 hypothetical protein F4813DRAFT_181843 [Daldinia decipiens]